MSTPLPIPSLETAFDEYIALLKTQTDVTSRKSQQLPDDIPFHRSLDRKFRTELDATSARVLRLTNKLLELADTLHKPDAKAVAKGTKRDSDEEKTLKDEVDVVDKFHSIVVDVVDPLLEHVDLCLDVHTGRLKPTQENLTRQEKPTVPSNVLQKTARLPQNILHSANLPKPQLRFLDQVDNLANSTWRHRMKKKWYAKGVAEDVSAVYESSTHPYLQEIHSIVYPTTLFTSRHPIPPKSFESTPLTYVDTVEGLSSMLDKLRQSEEIAIDLEYHSYRSYYGFVPLMQISNRDEDWVVDCLVPEVRASLEDLNEVFNNPNIIKVLHGAESDIPWLQQNFSLYIVNLFDTYHASRALDLPKHSLAFLLSAYCDFQADKRYQLADWRIRPLPDDMLHYARSDTHFLLFVYDQLREALLEKGKSRSSSPTEAIEDENNAGDETRFVRRVLKNSEETSLRVYVREDYDAEKGEGKIGWANLLRKWNKRALLVDGVPRSVFLAMHAWRDQLGRDEDESPVFVISNQALLNLVERAIPDNLTALYSSFPGAVPPLIRKRGNEFLKLMQDAASKAQIAISKAQIAAATARDVQMVDVEERPRHIVFSTQATPVPDLWSSVGPATTVPAGKGSMVAKGSSLFGKSLPTKGTGSSALEDSQSTSSRAKLSSRSSALFSGSALSGSSTSEQDAGTRDGNVLNAIAKIHEGILKGEKKVVVVQKQPSKKDAVTSAVASSTRTVATSVIPASSTPEPSSTIVVEALPTEIAFVPRSQRQPVQQDDDEIVMVGQRKKKRKRVDGEPAEEGRKKKVKSIQLQNTLVVSGQDSTAADEDDSAEELKVFDYAAEPNILDNGAKVEDVQEGSKKKSKRKDGDRGTKLDFRGFGPTPKKTNEPKSGNRSMSFR